MLKELIKSIKEQITQETFKIESIKTANENVQKSIDSLHLKSNAWDSKHELELESLGRAIVNLESVDIEAELSAHAALVTSGTATLETALFGVPQVVCYKGNYLSYLIGKQLIKVPFISLVNLIAGKKVVTELIQRELTTENLQQALSNILTLKNYFIS